MSTLKSTYVPSGPLGRRIFSVSGAISTHPHPLNGMLVHQRVIHSIKLTGTHLYAYLYTWVKRRIVSINGVLLYKVITVVSSPIQALHVVITAEEACSMGTVV